VLDRIANSLLQNAQQANPSLTRRSAGKIADEVKLDFVPVSEFLAPALDAGNHSQILNFRRMKPVGQRMHVLADIKDRRLEILQTSIELRSISL
jgi:hypothetical protein